jgi:hypothetical protein
MGPKLGRSGRCTKVICERCAAHPCHRGLGKPLRLCHSRVELNPKVPTLNVEPACSSPLDGDAGILSLLTESAQNRMRRPDDDAVWTQIPPLSLGGLCQVEEAVDVVTPLPLRAG